MSVPISLTPERSVTFTLRLNSSISPWVRLLSLILRPLHHQAHIIADPWRLSSSTTGATGAVAESRPTNIRRYMLGLATTLRTSFSTPSSGS
jgi:hypothetical protein